MDHIVVDEVTSTRGETIRHLIPHDSILEVKEHWRTDFIGCKSMITLVNDDEIYVENDLDDILAMLNAYS